MAETVIQARKKIIKFYDDKEDDVEDDNDDAN